MSKEMLRLPPNFYAVVERGVEDYLKMLDPDSTREGLVETPRRVAKMYEELTSGYRTDPAALFTKFETDGYSSLVLVKDIDFYSLCEHHLVIFSGRAHVGYIPQKEEESGKFRVVGLSKLARLVDIYARRLQLQERMTTQIADAVETHLSKNVMVVIEASHLCMEARGVKKPGSSTVTSAVRGDFLREPEARAEFLALIREK